jgi:CheY-like chemotaxis protein
MSKVLILSHNALLTKKEEKALEKAGVKVKAVSKYNDSLRKAIDEGFDIVVVDDDLFGGDVYQACRNVRGPGAIIILLGDARSWEIWEKRQDIGFDQYCRKPVKPGEMERKIKLALCELEYRQFREKYMLSKDIVTENAEAAADGETSGVEADLAEPTPVAGPEIEHETEPVVESATGPVDEQAGDIECQDNSEYQQETDLEAVTDDNTNIWQDPKVAKLISSLLGGKIDRISPEIDLRLEDGFTYREADDILGTSGRETSLVLESLAREGLLLKEDYEKILISPSGSVQLVPVERCPSCDSAQLNKGQLIEHFGCGYIGPEEDFNRGLKQVCPKCKRELKLIGTDYRKPGARYVCESCHGIFPTPVIKCHCLKTGEFYRLEELRHISLYAYSLNEAYRKRLEFELEPKKQLIDYLSLLGYTVQESVQIQGRSGAKHTIDLLASMEGLINKHTVAIGILAAPHDEAEVNIDSLFSFDSRIYDTGIENKMVIAVPRFSHEAMKFAERQGIRVYNIEELRALLCRQTGATEPRPTESRPQPDLAKLGPKGWLKWLLEQKGYHVAEDVQITGRSGAEHVLELYAQKDDGIINHRLAACVVKNEDDSEKDVDTVIKFDTAAYDAHIRDKVIISVPRLSKEARQFAEYQRIRVLEAKELAEFSGQYEANEVASRFRELMNST